MPVPWTPIFTQPTDSILLYALAREFDFRPLTKASANLATASVLLVMFRTGGPCEMISIMKAAGLVGRARGTLRSHVHYIRKALGSASVQQTDNTYMLTLSGRMRVEKAFKHIVALLNESIDPPFMRYTTVPYPSFPAHNHSSPG